MNHAISAICWKCRISNRFETFCIRIDRVYDILQISHLVFNNGRPHFVDIFFSLQKINRNMILSIFNQQAHLGMCSRLFFNWNHSEMVYFSRTKQLFMRSSICRRNCYLFTKNMFMIWMFICLFVFHKFHELIFN